MKQLISMVPILKRLKKYIKNYLSKVVVSILENQRLKKIISDKNAEVLNQAIKLHIGSDKRVWEQIIAPVNDGAAATQF